MKQFFILTILLAFSGCASIGENFEFKGTHSITIGKTNLTDIEKTYGAPFRVGYSSGNLQWTYLIYKYTIFSDAKIKDLVITFDEKHTVIDYTYSSSTEENPEK